MKQIEEKSNQISCRLSMDCPWWHWLVKYAERPGTTSDSTYLAIINLRMISQADERSIIAPFAVSKGAAVRSFVFFLIKKGFTNSLSF
ncbi:MAG: hypothetical protein ACLTW7_15795 [Enterococcus sp.]|uniref:hypothetical protein n=1 Tax=Enterococcus sp. TaxID=35783 RepID=UPI003994DF52